MELAEEMRQEQCVADILRHHIKAYAEQEVKIAEYDIEPLRDEYGSRGGWHRSIVGGGLDIAFPAKANDSV